MKIFLGALAVLFLLQWPQNPIFRIHHVNRLLTEAASAYTARQYNTSTQAYEKLLTELQWQSPALLLNLSHSYFHSQNLPLAQKFYELSTQAAYPGLAAKAYAQMGFLAYRQQQLEQALEHYKNALRQDPYNELARYNYELIKRKLQEEMPPEQQKKPEEDKQDAQNPQDNQEKEQQDNRDTENQEREAQPSQQRQIDELEMSEEKARMMLEALKENEIQYIQQQQQQKAKKSQGKNDRPDW